MTSPTNPGLARRIAERIDFTAGPPEARDVIQAELANDPVLREVEEALAKVELYPYGATIVQVSDALAKLDALIKGPS